MPKRIALTLILILGLSQAYGMGEPVERELPIPDRPIEELNYLLGFVGPQRADLREFKPERIAELLRFLATPKPKGTLYHADGPKDTPSAYLEADIARPLAQILRLTENPDIPAAFTAPSTVRMAHWESVGTGDRQRPKLWEHLPDLAAPVYFTGMEYLVNTPDQNTSAYYAYRLHRSVLLVQAGGRNLLISLSRQAGVSEVGKQGVILGPDDRWEYLYTGRSGLNRFGLGWVDSHMYDSHSVSLYLETDPGQSVRIGMFKWLRAGWSGVNLVRRTHIYEGLQRYAETLKQIVEHRRLADPAALTRSLLEIRKLPDARLREMVEAYLGAIRQQAEGDERLPAEQLDSLFKEGNYIDTLGRSEMESIVVLEYLKQLLGKPRHLDLQRLISKTAG